MPRRLALLNLVLLLVAGGAVAYIAREVTTPPKPMPLRARPAAVAEAPPAPTAPAVPPGAYAVVASKNLFSPTRTEGPPPAPAGGRPAAALPKPTLHGVILREGMPVAYLEDPATKRVAGYRLGDSVAGGTVQTISADHVVLARPEGTLDVRLRDPSKPRPAVPTVASPSSPLAGGGVGLPGMPAPGTMQPLPGVVVPGTQLAPGAVTTDPSGVPLPPRRVLPPNLLRRVPPSTGNATQ